MIEAPATGDSHAGHLFTEPGTLESVMQLSSEWFARHLHT